MSNSVFMPAIVFASSGISVDGGGVIITLGADGKLHIKKVGPGPDGWGIIPAAAATVLATKGKPGAEALYKEAVKALAENLGKLESVAKGGEVLAL